MRFARLVQLYCKVFVRLMKSWIEKIWKLPTPENRKSGLIPVSWFHYALRLDRDPDYVCYSLFNLLLIVGLSLTALIAIDAHLATGILVDADEFQSNKLLLPAIFSRLIGLPALGLTMLFYLRIRLPLNICCDDIPVLAHKALLLTTTRRRWIGRAAFVSIIGLLCIFLSHIVVIRIVLHFEKQESLGFILLPQIFAIIAVATGPLFLITYALVLEKVTRCFDSFEENVGRIDEFIKRSHNGNR